MIPMKNTTDQKKGTQCQRTTMGFAVGTRKYIRQVIRNLSRLQENTNSLQKEERYIGKIIWNIMKAGYNKKNEDEDRFKIQKNSSPK